MQAREVLKKGIRSSCSIPQSIALRLTILRDPVPESCFPANGAALEPETGHSEMVVVASSAANGLLGDVRV